MAGKSMTPLVLAALGVAGVALWSTRNTAATARSGKPCDPRGFIPDGWSCEPRGEDGGYVLTPQRSGEECDPLDLPIPGYVCVPSGDYFVLLPEAA